MPGRLSRLLFLLLLAGCNGEIYLRDGVTDGDTFYLAERALADPDPVLQSWVAYSLARSTCQLQIGGDNPARATSFDCELTAREHLLEAWSGHRQRDPRTADDYLDALSAVAAVDLLPEYVVHYHGHASWQLPGSLDMQDFDGWRSRHLRAHEAQTRLIGSWNYARNVTTARDR